MCDHVLRQLHACVCLAIRLAPVAVLLAVHRVQGRWPDQATCLARALRYGVYLHDWRKRPAALLTFVFVHVSSEHVLGNAVALTLALLAPVLQRGGMYAVLSAHHRDGMSTPLVDEDDAVYAACTQTLRSGVVFVLGSWGGLAVQLAERRYGATARARATAWCDQCATLLQRVCRDVIDGCGVYVTRLTGAASPCATALPVSSSSSSWWSPSAPPQPLLQTAWSRLASATAVQRLRRVWQTLWQPSEIAVGASAGVYALHGFNAVYHHKPLMAAMLLLRDAGTCVLQHVCSTATTTATTTAWQQQQSSSSLPQCTLPGESTAWSWWPRSDDGGHAGGGGLFATAVPVSTIATAAHVGGLLTGAVLGLLCRWCVQCARARQRRRQQRGRRRTRRRNG